MIQIFCYEILLSIYIITLFFCINLPLTSIYRQLLLQWTALCITTDNWNQYDYSYCKTTQRGKDWQSILWLSAKLSFIITLFTKLKRSRFSTCFNTVEIGINQKIMENKKPVMFYIFKDTSIWSFTLRFIYIWFIFESDIYKWGKQTNKHTQLFPGLVGPFSSCLKNIFFPSTENWKLLFHSYS